MGADFKVAGFDGDGEVLQRLAEDEDRNSRRVVVLLSDEVYFYYWQMIRGAIPFHPIEGLPEDAVLIGTDRDISRQMAVVYVQSMSYDSVPFGGRIPLKMAVVDYVDGAWEQGFEGDRIARISIKDGVWGPDRYA